MVEIHPIIIGPSLKETFHHCVAAYVGNPNAEYICTSGLLKTLIMKEQEARAWYDDLREIMPGDREVITEIRDDEQDHEILLSTILMEQGRKFLADAIPSITGQKFYPGPRSDRK
jgi:hypothetical protein